MLDLAPAAQWTGVRVFDHRTHVVAGMYTGLITQTEVDGDEASADVKI